MILRPKKLISSNLQGCPDRHTLPPAACSREKKIKKGGVGSGLDYGFWLDSFFMRVGAVCKFTRRLWCLLRFCGAGYCVVVDVALVGFRWLPMVVF